VEATLSGDASMETKCDALAALSSGRPPNSQKNLQRTQSLSGCGGIVSATKSGKACGDDFPATRPRRYLNVRFGSKADVTLLNFDVRFTPESGHSPTRSGCLLWAEADMPATFGSGLTCCSTTTGSENVNVEPWPGCDSTQIYEVGNYTGRPCECFCTFGSM
jgi:hypothetical protein